MVGCSVWFRPQVDWLYLAIYLFFLIFWPLVLVFDESLDGIMYWLLVWYEMKYWLIGDCCGSADLHLPFPLMVLMPPLVVSMPRFFPVCGWLFCSVFGLLILISGGLWILAAIFWEGSLTVCGWLGFFPLKAAIVFPVFEEHGRFRFGHFSEWFFFFRFGYGGLWFVAWSVLLLCLVTWRFCRLLSLLRCWGSADPGVIFVSWLGLLVVCPLWFVVLLFGSCAGVAGFGGSPLLSWMVWVCFPWLLQHAIPLVYTSDWLVMWACFLVLWLGTVLGIFWGDWGGGFPASNPPWSLDACCFCCSQPHLVMFWLIPISVSFPCC